LKAGNLKQGPILLRDIYRLTVLKPDWYWKGAGLLHVLLRTGSIRNKKSISLERGFFLPEAFDPSLGQQANCFSAR